MAIQHEPVQPVVTGLKQTAMIDQKDTWGAEAAILNPLYLLEKHSS